LPEENAMKSIRRLAVSLVTASILVACAGAAPATRPPVTTTSATIPALCRESHAQCFHNEDCCSGVCDYELYFCRP
jgi:hypothetical protein